MNVMFPSRTVRRGAVAYTAPMGIFLLLTAFEAGLPRTWYPLAYACKVLLVAASLLVFRAPLADIRPSRSVLLASIVAGMFVFVGWVAIEKLVVYPRLDARIGYNPFDSIADPFGQYAFVALRLFGLALVVPVMEELFWRSFLLRFLTDHDFAALPFDGFSWTAFAGVAGLFAVAHPEWLSAALTACVYGLLLWRTRSIFATIVAHATTNAALGLYILVAHDWMFW